MLTTAVWVGDPDGYTEMTAKNTPEFYELDGVEAVQGGTYPARIWRALMEPALAGVPVEDWAAPPPTERKAVRLFLPGEECAYRLVSGTLPVPGATTTTTEVPPVQTYPPSVDPDTGETIPGGVVETTPTTVAPVVVQLIPATTIAPENLDPLAPMPTVDLKTPVLNCAALPANVVTTKTTAPPLTSP